MVCDFHSDYTVGNCGFNAVKKELCVICEHWEPVCAL